MLRVTGKIYTGLVEPETTDCLLVGDDGVIVAVGEEAKRAADADIEERVLGDRVGVPGFIDAHVHVEGLARQLTQLMLDDARSRDEVLMRVAERARSVPFEQVIVGVGWDESNWVRPAILDRSPIDRVAPRHAVVLRRVDGHLWVVNSEALRRIHCRDDLTDEMRKRLDDVSIDGELREDDILLASPLVAFTPEALRDGLAKAVRHAVRHGVTTLQDMGSVTLGKEAGPAADTVIDGLAELDREGELPVRVVGCLRLSVVDQDAPADAFERVRGDRLYPGAVKLFLDGSIGAQTAALSEPFADDPGNTGRLLWDEAELERVVARLHTAGLQLALHAIGDRAIGQALDVLERVLERHPRADHRHRIEHLELVTPRQIERMAALGLVASMQPNFIGRWQGPGGLYATRLGKRRETMNPLRSLLDAGVPLAFGSDGMPFGPLYGIRSAMDHTTTAERLSFTEALRAYTLTAAFAGGIEHLTGSIEPGKQADLTVLSADPQDSDDVTVETVYVAGGRA